MDAWQLGEGSIRILAAGPIKGLTVNPPPTYILEQDHLLVVMGLMEHLQDLPKT